MTPVVNIYTRVTSDDTECVYLCLRSVLVTMSVNELNIVEGYDCHCKHALVRCQPTTEGLFGVGLNSAPVRMKGESPQIKHLFVFLQGSTPSNTSRYFSVDFGLVHLVALDFNMYYGDDPCGMPCAADQLTWLKEDLAKANKNRQNIPWVMAMAHYPVYCTGCNGNSDVTGEYYSSADAELYGNCNVSASQAYGAKRTASRATPPKSVRGASNNLVSDMQPILASFGVDFFMAGHWHYYESLYPGVKGTAECLSCLQPTQKNFVNPKGTIHVTTGNGGPPGKDSFTEHCPGEDCGNITSTRAQTTEFGYGRLVVHNSSHAEFTQYFNANGSVFDHFVVVQTTHKPFDQHN
eukprot:m.8228 g.8228  ORF g.8228 m.8228 type:complete len:350 (+) comp6141_c0_seq2:1542-2591(+)